MKCQTLFSEKNKKNINMLAAKSAQRVVKINTNLHFGIWSAESISLL